MAPIIFGGWTATRKRPPGARRSRFGPRPASTEPDPPGEEGGHSRWRWGDLATLLAVTGLAVSQPLLSVAGASPTLFTFAGVRGGDLVLVALLVALVPPLLLWSVTVGLGRIDRRAGDVAMVVIVACAVGLAAVQVVKSTGIERTAIVGLVGLTATVGFGFAYARVGPLRLWTRYLAPLPFLAIALLLGASPSGELLRSPRAAGTPVDAAEGTPPVVFLMFDELPLATILADDEEIDAVRFPNFARLAERSTWYRDFTTMAQGTTVAVPSALTGQEPRGGHRCGPRGPTTCSACWSTPTG